MTTLPKKRKKPSSKAKTMAKAVVVHNNVVLHVNGSGATTKSDTSPTG